MSDLEDKLRSLALRPPPADLRREVLAGVEAAIQRQPRWTWRDWLWPSPFAWGALATILAGALLFDSAISSSGGGPAPSPVVVQPDSSEPTLYAFCLHRPDLIWLESRP